MHIPDGYLSPVTCVSLYGAAAPFWYVALRKLRSRLHTRLIPLLSLFAAFSFVIMMFNVPLPGGTSGHAVGLGISAAVLGPWASMIAISIALLIQAILFALRQMTVVLRFVNAFALCDICIVLLVMGSLFAGHRAIL